MFKTISMFCIFIFPPNYWYYNKCCIEHPSLLINFVYMSVEKLHKSRIVLDHRATGKWAESISRQFIKDEIYKGVLKIT